MEKKGFKVLFCERFNCPPADYENRAFRRGLYWHARLIAPVLRLLSPKFFAEDFKLMRELGMAIDWREANTEILSFQDTNRERKNFLRTSLRIRISGRNAANLAQKLFSDERRNRVLP